MEREQRAAADAKAAVQEAALRSRLEAEQKRLAEGSAQLASLEAIAEENQATLRQRQTNEEREGAARATRFWPRFAPRARRMAARSRMELAAAPEDLLVGWLGGQR